LRVDGVRLALGGILGVTPRTAHSNGSASIGFRQAQVLCKADRAGAKLPSSMRAIVNRALDLRFASHF
jgi:hypothetical protein